jgi:3-methyladenine DNA glycosylase AlkD
VAVVSRPSLRSSASAIRAELRRLADPKHAAALGWFFKTAPGEYAEGDRFLGLRVPDLRRLSRTYRDAPLPAITALLESRWHEERLLALFLLVGRYTRGTPAERERIFRLYLRHARYVNNWDLVDSSAGQILGAHLEGRSRATLTRLARSRIVWERRMAVIATSHDIRRGQFDETLRIARLLLHDPHDLIHKAVGWMLREVGNRDRAAEEAFLRQHAADMPRTMLRYAIEKFPAPLRRRYLAMRSPLRT